MNSRNNVKGDNRPTDYEYACLSKHVYSVADTTLEVGTKFKTRLKSWTISFISAPHYCGYFGAVYECQETKQFVVAHRGTNNMLDYFEDYIGVVRNKCSFQKSEAFRVVDLIVQKIRSSPDYSDYGLSFTGHSLGAFLAELSVYYSTVVLDFPEVHAVSFESPGSLQSMKSICWRHLPQIESKEHDRTRRNSSVSFESSRTACDGLLLNNPFNLISSSSWPSLQLIPHDYSHTSLSSHINNKDFNSIVRQLDIISYVCYPNIVNTCNTHAGTLYAINIRMEDYKRIWPQRLFSSHSIVGIVEWFKKALEGDPSCIRLLMADWPQNYAASETFFKHAKFSKEGMLSVENLLDAHQFSPAGVRAATKQSHPRSKRQVKQGGSNPLSRASIMDFDKWIKKQKEKFVLKFHANFNIVHGSTSALPFHHFSIPMQTFLKYFYQKRNYIFSKYTTNQEVEVLKTFLTEFWTGFEMPEEVREELLSFRFQQNKLFVREIVCKRCNVHDFRQLLSCWLEKTGFIVDELINVDLVGEVMWKLKGSSIRK